MLRFILGEYGSDSSPHWTDSDTKEPTSDVSHNMRLYEGA